MGPLRDRARCQVVDAKTGRCPKRTWDRKHFVPALSVDLAYPKGTPKKANLFVRRRTNPIAVGVRHLRDLGLTRDPEDQSEGPKEPIRATKTYCRHERSRLA